MINLLPQKEKKVMAMETAQRKLSVILFSALIALGCFVAILFFTQNYTYSRMEDMRDTVLAKEAELQTTNFEDFRKTVIKANQGLAKIRNFWSSQVAVAPLLETMADLTPSSIYFNSLSFDKDFNPADSQCRIVGLAQTRGALFYFKQNLENEPSLVNIYFAPSSWVKPTDVNFSLSFDLAE